ncbi:MAG: S-adenosylmethionine:tRNA ribosyltransferase-isomerase, partial [Parvicella sp.]
MNTEDFFYELPAKLIAQEPPEERAKSRLLTLKTQASEYQQLEFRHFYQLCNKGDLLVLNDTRVIPARLFLEKLTGGKVEVMLERFITDDEFIALARSNKPLKPDCDLYLDKELVLRYLGKRGKFSHFQMLYGQGAQLFRDKGHIPLPPYIQRQDQPEDVERYQTVYAANEG